MLKSDNICHNDSIPPYKGDVINRGHHAWLKDDDESIVSRLKLMYDIYKHARYFTHT